MPHKNQKTTTGAPGKVTTTNTKPPWLLPNPGTSKPNVPKIPAHPIINIPTVTIPSINAAPAQQTANNGNRPGCPVCDQKKLLTQFAEARDWESLQTLVLSTVRDCRWRCYPKPNMDSVHTIPHQDGNWLYWTVEHPQGSKPALIAAGPKRGHIGYNTKTGESVVLSAPYLTSAVSARFLLDATPETSLHNVIQRVPTDSLATIIAQSGHWLKQLCSKPEFTQQTIATVYTSLRDASNLPQALFLLPDRGVVTLIAHNPEVASHYITKFGTQFTVPQLQSMAEQWEGTLKELLTVLH